MSFAQATHRGVHDRALHALATSFRAQAPQPRSARSAARAEDLAAWRADLRDAVGVEDEQRRRARARRDVGEQLSAVGPSSVPSRPPPRPCRPCGRSAAAGDRRRPARAARPGHDLHVGVGDGAEAPVGDLLASSRCSSVSNPLGRARRRPPRAACAARARSPRGRLGPLPWIVADQRGPAAVGRGRGRRSRRRARRPRRRR